VSEFMPTPRHGFKLQLGGKESASYFKAVSGLGASINPSTDPHVDNQGKPTLAHVSANPQYQDIVLTRGIDTDQTLWEWFKQAAIDGDIEGACVDGTIELVNSKLDTIATWSFVKGYPINYDFGAVDAGTEDVGVEMIVIKHHGLEKA
jgi:phage tail-like protein